MVGGYVTKTRIGSIASFVLVMMLFLGLMEWMRASDAEAKARCFHDAQHASMDGYIAQQLFYSCSVRWDSIGDFWRIYGN